MDILYNNQRSFYKIFVKFRNSKKNVLKIVLIIVNKSLISNQFSPKNYFVIVFNFYLRQIVLQEVCVWGGGGGGGGRSFLRGN